MISRRTAFFIAIVAFFLGAGVGVAGWIAISGGSGEPSQDVQSVVPTLSLRGNSNTGTPTPRGKAIPLRFQTPEATPAPSEPIPYARALYRINPEASQARFILQEDLRGVRIDVIGITNQVAGDFIVDFATPENSQVGAIAVNARTLETDNGFRNQAIRGQILRSAEAAFEFITFTPTALVGLPEEPVTQTGESLTFEIEGDLTIIGNTRPVTFTAVVTATDLETLSGTASVTVLWRDWGIRIPSVPGVANITEEVTLELDFVADLVEAEEAEEGDGEFGDVGYSVGLFRLSPQNSTATFTLQEDLRGVRIDVVGVTNQVAGDIIVNLEDPSASQVGVIAINARTIETDNSFRNQAIRGQILRSAEAAFEFITFTPTAIVGLSSNPLAGIGETVAFEVQGDLTIIGNTRPVTFVVTATLTDAETLTGEAVAVVRWRDWGIRIPSVPSVANITEEVTLALSFSANLIDSE
jgi:polyisoprenoid-binding protein YceI